MIKIKSPNWKKVSGQMKKAGKLHNNHVKKALLKSVILISATASKNAPVKTGTLRRSITQYGRQNRKASKSGNDLTAKVGSRVRYAGIQEDGSKYIKGRKFLINAINRHRSYVSKLLQQAMSDTIRKV